MTQVNRLIKTRRQQRDAAAEELTRARRRLEQLLAEQSRLSESCRENLHGAVGSDALRSHDLELMSIEQQLAEHSTQAGEEALAEARKTALELQRMLRQLEILHEREAQRQRLAEKSRQRREQDEFASRIGRKLFLLALVCCCGQVLGCNKNEEQAQHTEPDSSLLSLPAIISQLEQLRPKLDSGPEQGPDKAAAKSRSQATDARPDLESAPSVPDAARLPDAMIFTLAELKQAQQLKRQAAALKQKEAELLAQQQKLAEQQQQAARKVAAAAAAPPPKAPKADSGPPPPPPVNLVEVLKGMNARASAAMLAAMSPDIAAQALRGLTAASVARILAQMSPESAAPIGARLAQTPRRRQAVLDAGTVTEGGSAQTDAGQVALSAQSKRSKRGNSNH